MPRFDIVQAVLAFVIMWLFNQLPVSEPAKSIVNGVVAILLVLAFFSYGASPLVIPGISLEALILIALLVILIIVLLVIKRRSVG